LAGLSALAAAAASAGRLGAAAPFEDLVCVAGFLLAAEVVWGAFTARAGWASFFALTAVAGFAGGAAAGRTLRAEAFFLPGTAGPFGARFFFRAGGVGLIFSIFFFIQTPARLIWRFPVISMRLPARAAVDSIRHLW
jgi:hypothetical protein